VTTTAVRRLGARYEREIATQVADFPDVRDTAPFLNLGVAHGWAGVLYASLRWSALARRRPTLRVRRRLAQLAACAEPFGRGLRWPWREPGSHTAERGYMAGWCNGSAGFVHLWLQAHATLGDTEWERLATAAAWSTWDAGEEDNIDLCCGHAGRAYALLALFRHTGDRQWLDRATRLAQIAATTARSSGSELTCLYKSGLGTALLAAELDRPEAARMPLFEHEGWPADR
jgi:serine/threonine-protein kinase